MARCYSVPVKIRQPSIPLLWLVSDARNDAVIERVLPRLPPGSGLIYRHYHLPPAERRARFDRLAGAARRFGHVVVLSGDARTARRWGADGAYGAAERLTAWPQVLRLATAHTLRELAKAQRAGADAVLLSPVFPTASHPGGKALGPVRFRLIAAHAQIPVIALGGMTGHRARAHRLARWAAIDGLS
ncbi:thiamine phosphate synthase [Novosphingobium sp. AP12]|uniref:thiamine phosphate synthase n=1 Tax=Novosphingobium sp. AP12 TaxID=1144305 RepID=UPI000272147D|nr:thiamine phosphate synthase [Novosphingobium sp. AP12]EJL33848.1 thiamine monophosphate synthase [Novosphingobium sp. AP12]